MSAGPENRRCLSVAVGVSLLLHLLGLSIADATLRRDRVRPKDSAAPALAAELRATPPSSPLPAAPELSLPEPKRKAAAAQAPRTDSSPAAPRRAAVAGAAISRKALEQLAEHLLYPLEAVNRGLEGEVLVRLSLDARGNVLAARVEASSGHAILDQAAVAATRQLRALPGGDAGDILLPVRFRLD